MMRVIKIGGRAQADPALGAAIAGLWRDGRRDLCVVHGGGDEVTAMQRRLGASHQAAFVDGRRVTSAADLETLRMVLSGSVNKRLTSQLVSLGVPAVGLSGEDAALFDCVRAQGGALGEVGDVREVHVDVLRHLLSGGYLPLVSPVGRNGTENDGSALNVNGDDAASALAAAMQPSALWFVSDVAGVLADGRARAVLDADDIATLLQTGEAHGGMRAKLDASLRALHAGVSQVRIGDLSLLRDASCGTTITLTPVAA